NVNTEAVIAVETAESIYEVPLYLEAAGLSEIVARQLELPPAEADLRDWRAFVQRLRNPSTSARIAIVGKYVELHDAYLSIKEALIHAGVHHGAKLDLHWVHSEDLEDR